MKVRKVKRMKLLSFFLSVMLLFCLAPTAVFAAESGELWVNGINIAADPDKTITCGEGTAVYDRSTSTLTLTDATITNMNSSGRAIDSPSDLDLVINLVGTSAINVASSGIFASKNVTITGDGSLTITTTSFNCVSSAGEIVIDGATVKATSAEDGAIAAESTVNIKNGAKVEATGLYFGIDTIGNLILTGAGTKLNATAKEENCNATSINGDISITNKANFEGKSFYPFLFSKGNIIISDSTVNGTSTNDGGIFTPKTLSIQNGSDVTSNSYYSAIKGKTAINITDSKIKAISSNDTSIFSSNDITISNSNVEANGLVGGIASNGLLKFTSSVITANGTNDTGIYGNEIAISAGKINSTGLAFGILSNGKITFEKDYNVTSTATSTNGGIGIQAKDIVSIPNGYIHAIGSLYAIRVFKISDQADLTTPPSDTSQLIQLNDNYGDTNGAVIYNSNWGVEGANDGGNPTQKWVAHSYFANVQNEPAQDVTIQIKKADYSKVEAAIAKANSLNKAAYKDFSAVTNAINAVENDKDITEQDTVDGYATAIENAIKALEKKDNTNVAGSPQTGDSNNMTLWITLLLFSGISFNTLIQTQKNRRKL